MARGSRSRGSRTRDQARTRAFGSVRVQGELQRVRPHTRPAARDRLPRRLRRNGYRGRRQADARVLHTPRHAASSAACRNAERGCGRRRAGRSRGELPRRARRARRCAPRRCVARRRSDAAGHTPGLERALGVRGRQRSGRGTSDLGRGNQHGNPIVVAPVHATRARARCAARRRGSDGRRPRLRARLAAQLLGTRALCSCSRPSRDAPPPAARALLPLLRAAPSVLTIAARLGGKVRPLRARGGAAAIAPAHTMVAATAPRLGDKDQ